MQEFIEKASHLIEALPYIRHFYGKTFVVKCGGAAMTQSEHLQSIMRDIALLHFCGIRLIIVHGGGPEISAMCDQLNLAKQFVNGQRVTDAATIEVVQMVLIGKVNKTLVSALNQQGVKAVGLSGQDGRFIHAEKMDIQHADLGYVGKIINLDADILDTLLTKNFLPIIAPIGMDKQGQAYNINADIAASAVASKLKAEKIIYLTDVNGFYADINDPKSRIQTITKTAVKNLLAENKINGGMIPKLQSCIHALENDVTCAHILDGNMAHSLLLEIFTDQGVGTLITH